VQTAKNRGGQKCLAERKRRWLSGWFALRKKKKIDFAGKVDLLLRRKEIRVVLLALCKSNNHATVSFLWLLLVLAGFMGIVGGEDKEAKEERSTIFLTLVARKRGYFLFYAVVSPNYVDLFFCTSMWREFFGRELKIGHGELRSEARTRCSIKNYTRASSSVSFMKKAAEYLCCVGGPATAVSGNQRKICRKNMW